jgi:hypothetical protein
MARTSRASQVPLVGDQTVEELLQPVMDQFNDYIRRLEKERRVRVPRLHSIAPRTPYPTRGLTRVRSGHHRSCHTAPS